MDVSAIMTTAVGTLGTTFGDIAPIAIGLAISVFGLHFGWNLVKSFVH